MTATSTPDPQVVAWTPEVGDDIEDRRTGSVANVTAVSERAFLRFKNSGVKAVVPLSALRRNYRPASGSADAYQAARRPLTVEDIPAGQGAASLHIDHGALRWREPDGRQSRVLLWRKPDRFAPPQDHALWALIEAHVPTIEEQP